MNRIAFDDVPHDAQPELIAATRGVDPVVASVRADLLERSVLGIAKYGTTLDTLTPRAAIQHAYEEALDLANYLKRLMMMMDGAS